MSEEIDVIKLELDVVPVKIGDFLCMATNEDIFHINYAVERTDYEKNKDKILEDICYKLQFNYMEKPKEIENADILIVIDRVTTKVINIVKQGFIKKEKIKELMIINNIDYLKFLLEKMIESR